MNPRFLFTLSFLLLLNIPFKCYSQLNYDESITDNRKNIVRINPTPSFIAGLESVAFGYERRIKDHQSVSLNVGRLKFREFANFNLEEYSIDQTKKSGGVSIAADYRRYFTKRNRTFAPDGLYWGPFVTYYQYNFEWSLLYTDPLNASTTDLSLSAELSVFHVGIQLGYQFIIAKRLAIDLILLGPSFGKYRANFDLGGSVKVNKDSEVYKEFYDKITDRIPGAARLLDSGSLSAKGDFSTNSIGMRYVFQIGFLF